MLKPLYFIASLCCISLLSSESFAYSLCSPYMARTKPSAMYHDNNDGTVTDTRTKLMWQKCSLGQGGAQCDVDTAKKYTWTSALNAAQEANKVWLLGFNDWRLPSITELRTLVEEVCLPTINNSLFPNTQSDSYWSSSPFAHTGRSSAWFISFTSGYEDHFSKSGDYHVRLVRNSQ